MKTIRIIGLFLLYCVLITSCQNDEQIEYNRYFTTGSLLFRQHCQNCHGSQGQGLVSLIPSLRDTLFLKKHYAELPCILSQGLHERINVGNKMYDTQMPAINLSPIEIAQVLTYVLNSFGNNMGPFKLEKTTAALRNCR